MTRDTKPEAPNLKQESMKSLDAANKLTDKEIRILSKCRNAIQSIDASAEVVLYGSRARGDAAPDSDFDLLILTDQAVDLQQEARFSDALFSIEIETEAVLTVISYNRQQWNSPLHRAMPFRQNVEKDGVIV
jgi:predicted nucleotidyltransferase